MKNQEAQAANPQELKDQIRFRAEADLEFFIRLVAPYRVLGAVHKELITWWNREDALSHQLALLPRDHGKSAMMAYRVAWYLTKHPDHRVLYISSTANLAEKQLGLIKTIFTSDIYRTYWPEMINLEESKREKWTTSEISLDHPIRKQEGIRDPSIFTAGLTTSVTGLHCDVAVLDDVVVKENAYTEEGRNRVKEQYSLLASIEGADALEWCVGTRYHPKDLYGSMQEMKEDTFSPEGEVVDSKEIYEIFERQVESKGDGTGEFLWPRQQRTDGKWFGFDKRILARKKGQYLDRTQFRAQYYNDPNDPESATINYEDFQYYDRNYLQQNMGYWFFNGQRLNVIAAVDLAYSPKNKKRDHTAITVVGVTGDFQYYILDIDRFQTDRIQDYFNAILKLHQKWGFRKMVAEVGAAQGAVVKAIKDQCRMNGLSLSFQEVRHTRISGTKIERIMAVLEPRYQNHQVWHYRGGNCQVLEDELVRPHSPTDDVKDAAALAVDNIVAPSASFIGRINSSQDTKFNRQRLSASRFGGIR
tara:strand:+ start:2469 stop:4061 length:1593 start_codon:yes stop_codon:yes gene_type:complete